MPAQEVANDGAGHATKRRRYGYETGDNEPWLPACIAIQIVDMSHLAVDPVDLLLDIQRGFRLGRHSKQLGDNVEKGDPGGAGRKAAKHKLPGRQALHE